MNMNKIIMYLTVRWEDLLYIKNKIVAKKEISRILKRPLGIRKNLSIEVYS